MGEPWGVVLVPTDEGAALQASCVLARPPSGWRSLRDDGGAAGGGHQGPTRELDAVDGEPPIVAINGHDGPPLWWAGALVPDGWDRARRVWWDRPRGVRVDVDAARAASLAFPAVEDVVRLARALEAAGLCRVVLLDLVDGAVVERAP